MATINGEGTIVQLERDKAKGKCRKWQLRVCTGMDPRTGKYRVRTRRVTGTHTEATKAMREFIAELEADKVPPRRGLTFEQECERLCRERRANGGFSENRNRTFETALKAACRHIGKARFERVTPEMLNDMYAAMRAGDTLSGKPASGTYIRNIHTQVSLVYKQAVKEGRVAENPCERATPPRNDTKPKRAMSARAMADFIGELVVTDEHDFAYWLMAKLGLRRGEVCGLSWEDVDEGAQTVSINHSYDSRRNLKDTKTSAGRRVLPLTDEAAEAFQAHRDQQIIKGFPAGPENPVVITEAGTRVHPDILEKWWKRDRQALGARDFTMHELRHSYLTALARNGVHPTVMQELAGHASSAITMDIYTHVSMDGKRQAAEKLEKALQPLIDAGM